MADPRNAVDFEGIGAEYASYLIDNSTITYDATKTDGSAQVGLAVTLSAGRTVALTADASYVRGKLILVESDGKANVQVEGFMTLPGGASATLTHGTPIVGALGASSARGYIRSAASAAAAELLVAKGAIQDNTDATNVVVDL
jgi:hypothetical protein